MFGMFSNNGLGKESLHRVMIIVGNAMRGIEVLKAARDPDLKRRLHLTGEYKKHKDIATEMFRSQSMQLAVFLEIARADKGLQKRFTRAITSVQNIAKDQVNGEEA